MYFKVGFYFMYMSVCLYITFRPGDLRDQKRVLDPLGLCNSWSSIFFLTCAQSFTHAYF